MDRITTDIAIVGAGGAGLRAAIAAAEARPDLEIALISKVYPMRSHTVAAEGGAAGVAQDHDRFEDHFEDTVAGGDWLCEQDVVDFFVRHAAAELTRLEHWGCPWSRQADGRVAVRAFGAMRIERTWYAADKTGFHMLTTLFQTALRHPGIRRFDEHFCLDLLVADGRVQGVVALDLAAGTMRLIQAKAVILATGGAGRVYRFNTNGGIVTGDGLALAYRHGVPLRDMEFVQYHPTGLPGTGVLVTEGCRGEGGILLNRDGYRYLQDYGLGPETPVGQPRNRTMELGPRDRLSQAFWFEQQKGRTLTHPVWGDVVQLDLRHLGAARIDERLPFVRELARAYANVDPVHEPIPVRPAVHYTMGGIETDRRAATRLPGLFAVGECASTGLHGANRLGSNSLTELLVFGRLAGEEAAQVAATTTLDKSPALLREADAIAARARSIINPDGQESIPALRDELGEAMEAGLGIFRTEEGMQQTTDQIASLKHRYRAARVTDPSSVFNTEWLQALELGFLLDVAEAMAHSALARRESRGAHHRLDAYRTRDDEQFLKHTLARFRADGPPEIQHTPVTITTSPPARRSYGDDGQGSSEP
ncbi:fumarate reductase (quinol) flavoprotein subunit [Thioalkalicoccus limnaeus]|uniref:Fumarate reductase flavoprotein subunit n=1 Tax=Thioalkalicoccus limnaeus TaxID=120681 RepID=A0ABV4BJT0_9GAMM